MARLVALVCVAAAAALVMGCDAKPPKPETGSIAVSAPAADLAPASAVTGERSIRLFGRGISRQRQIRI